MSSAFSLGIFAPSSMMSQVGATLPIGGIFRKVPAAMQQLHAFARDLQLDLAEFSVPALVFRVVTDGVVVVTVVGGGGYDAYANSGSNVASGALSVVVGGLNNIANNDMATVAGGIGNKATGWGSFVGGGGYDGTYWPNVASGAGSAVGHHQDVIPLEPCSSGRALRGNLLNQQALVLRKVHLRSQGIGHRLGNDAQPILALHRRQVNES